ncbi:MAG: rRNA pseudouridine synthase [Candidatus Hydrogenedentes bacterium]|nr:rRNA pseudouridine synthase [Candidatus Hydrogenedentota bacterium]
MPSELPENEPLRISKLLASRGICSRREADDFIARGLVLIDGERVAQLGEKVLPTQKLTLDPRAQGELGDQITILLHKPLGYVSGQAEDGYSNAASLIAPTSRHKDDRSGIVYLPKHRQNLAPAGRLDIDSTGLLVLTQDGTIARTIIGSESSVDKEYLVRVSGEVTPQALALLCHGLELDGRQLRPAQVTRTKGGQLRFILREGRKRQIRRMCELVGLKVEALQRIRIGKVHLADLPYGKWRYLGPGERF